MKKITFTKLQALGNDFVLLDLPEIPDWLTPHKIKWICDRRYGIGADQLILLTPSDKSTRKITFYNQDGSSAEACGNGTRAAFWALQEPHATLETSQGIVTGQCGERISVESPLPTFMKDEDLQDLPSALGKPLLVDVGNPHCVFFPHEEVDISTWGPFVENHPVFPHRINVGFCRIISPERIDLTVWERGAGLTPACGTGACAAAFAAFQKGWTQAEMDVHQEGGKLKIKIAPPVLIQEGPASLVFTGTFLI